MNSLSFLPARLRRTGLTLVEILIALTMTLIVLGAMMTAFQYASEQMQSGRALMELANRARSAEGLLRTDLANLTVDVRPYAQTAAPNGFFELVEGTLDDDSARLANVSTGGNLIDSYLGDIDDLLGMSVRNAERPFRGRSTPITAGAPPTVGVATIIESSLAEVWWFTTFQDLNSDGIGFDDTVRLHRRVLLIRPDLGVLMTDVNEATVNAFIANNDISCRVIPSNAGETLFNVVANNLADLAVRKNRFCHRWDPFDPTAANRFPNEILGTLIQARRNPANDDILLTDVAGFDLRVFSPNASVNTNSDIVVEPSDPGFDPTPANVSTLGAFVDLGHSSTSGGSGWFSALCYGNNYTFAGNVYDTWTPFYESDGINQDNDGLIDEATDGFDNFADGAGRHVTSGGSQSNGVDDTAERETLPPYPFPVRGMKVNIRMVEKGTKQVHQTTVVQSFVPE